MVDWLHAIKMKKDSIVWRNKDTLLVSVSTYLYYEGMISVSQSCLGKGKPGK